MMSIRLQYCPFLDVKERDALCPAALLFYGSDSRHELQHGSGKHLPPGDCNTHQCSPER